MKTIRVQTSGYDDSASKVLTDFMAERNSKTLRDLRGKIEFCDDYDYKLMRC